MSNSFASGNGVNGIRISLNEDINVHDCFVTLSGENGIHVNTSDNISLVNVVSKNNNGESRMCINNTNNVRLTNCQFYDDRGTPVQDFGIINGDTSTTNYIELTDRKLMPNKIAVIYSGSGEIITVAMLVRFYQL